MTLEATGEAATEHQDVTPARLRAETRTDRFGAFASGLCAVHCAFAALLPAAFGALGVGFLAGHTAEWIFTLVAAALASTALVMGWRRHRSPLVASLLVLGIAGLFVSRILESGGHEGHEESDAVGAEHAEDDLRDGHTEDDLRDGHTEDDLHDGREAHDDHGDAHEELDAHGHTERDAHSVRAHEGHHDDHHAHHGVAGPAVGILAGLLLFGGHLLNIRRRREACC